MESRLILCGFLHHERKENTSSPSPLSLLPPKHICTTIKKYLGYKWLFVLGLHLQRQRKGTVKWYQASRIYFWSGVYEFTYLWILVFSTSFTWSRGGNSLSDVGITNSHVKKKALLVNFFLARKKFVDLTKKKKMVAFKSGLNLGCLQCLWFYCIT